MYAPQTPGVGALGQDAWGWEPGRPLARLKRQTFPGGEDTGSDINGGQVTQCVQGACRSRSPSSPRTALQPVRARLLPPAIQTAGRPGQVGS